MGKLSPFFSVIIPTYNRGPRLARTLESLRNQTFRDFEVLVEDDGSSDNTAEVVESFGDLNIHYSWTPNSGGPATPRNHGIDHAVGEWVCFLDADDVWFPQKLEAVRTVISQDSEIDVIGHDANMVRGDESVVVRVRCGPARPNFYRHMLVRGNCCSTSTMSIRRELLNRHGLRFNTAPEFVIVEDYDLWLHLARVGARFYFINTILSDYLVSWDNISLNSARAVRNLEALLRHHVFHVQTFERDCERLWWQASFELDLSRVRELWQNGRRLAVIRHAIRIALRDPIRGARHAAVMWRRKLKVRRTELQLSAPHLMLEKISGPYRITRSFGRALGIAPENSLRVLLYHDIPPHEKTRFAAQMRWLAGRYSFVTPQRFAAMICGAEPVRGFNLLVSFDDGFASNRVIAEQVLNPMGISALFFVVSTFVDIEELEISRQFISNNISPGKSVRDLPLHWRNMRWSDLEALLEQGHTIGSHGATHRRLSTISPQAELEHEIIGSADQLMRRLGTPIEHLAFPFGDLHSFSPTALAVARRRFRFVHSGLRGDNVKHVSPFAVRRDGATMRVANNEYAVLSNSLMGAFVEGASDVIYASQRRQLDAWCKVNDSAATAGRL